MINEFLFTCYHFGILLLHNHKTSVLIITKQWKCQPYDFENKTLSDQRKVSARIQKCLFYKRKNVLLEQIKIISSQLEKYIFNYKYYILEKFFNHFRNPDYSKLYCSTKKSYDTQETLILIIQYITLYTRLQLILKNISLNAMYK